jgi:hypothetical protein
MAEDEGDALLPTQIGDLVPRKDAFDGHDEILPIGPDRLQELSRVAPKVAVQKHLSFLVENADVHEPRMKIDPAVVLVCPRVKSHRPLLL